MKLTTLSLSIMTCLALTGCATYDPYTGEQEVSNATKGAGIGAGVATLVAYLANKDEDDVRKRNQRILKAAAGGAAIGGGVGYYMDTQEAELRKQLRGSGVSNITFNSGKSDIAPSFLSVLDSVVLVLKEFDKTLVVVAGHTDSSGSEALNQRLSEQRAQSVSNYLSNAGVLADRLDTVGFGEMQPIADNNTAEGKELNRRVEITLLPIAQ